MHSLNLLAKLMVLHRRILMVLHRLAIAAVAEVINPPTHAESFKIFLLFLTLSFSLSSCFFLLLTPFRVPAGSPRGGDVTVDAPDMNQPSLPPPFWFCCCVCFCLYGPFNCISFHKFSHQLSAFSLCSSGLISALLVLSTIHLFMKGSPNADVILCG